MEQQDGSADLFANFSGVMILIVAILMASVHVKESLIEIKNNHVPVTQQSASADQQHLSLLEIPYQENGETLFYWKASEDSHKQTFTSYANIRAAIKAARPDGIRLRLDGRVPSEIYQKLNADAYNLNFIIYQSSQKERES